MKKIAERLKRAVKNSLTQIFRPGTSKRDARAEQNKEALKKALAEGKSESEIKKMPQLPSPYIHSFNTYYQYLDICMKYATWLAEHHSNVQKLAYAHRRGYDREYIQEMIDRGLAASTVARTTAALAKLYRCHMNDIHDRRPERHYEDFTRSRGYNSEKYEQDKEKFGEIVEICRATGVREIELEHLYPECFREDDKGKLYVHLDGKKQHTKGGKTRDVVILERHQKRMREIISSCVPGKLICPKAPSHLDVHGIRSLYAMDYYDEIARPIEEIPPSERVRLKRPKIDNSRPNQIRTTAPAIYQRRSDGRKFDRAAMLTVSESLGHSRVDVMVHSYLR